MTSSETSLPSPLVCLMSLGSSSLTQSAPAGPSLTSASRIFHQIYVIFFTQTPFKIVLHREMNIRSAECAKDLQSLLKDITTQLIQHSEAANCPFTLVCATKKLHLFLQQYNGDKYIIEKLKQDMVRLDEMLPESYHTKDGDIKFDQLLRDLQKQYNPTFDDEQTRILSYFNCSSARSMADCIQFLVRRSGAIFHGPSVIPLFQTLEVFASHVLPISIAAQPLNTFLIQQQYLPNLQEERTSQVGCFDRLKAEIQEADKLERINNELFNSVEESQRLCEKSLAESILAQNNETEALMSSIASQTSQLLERAQERSTKQLDACLLEFQRIKSLIKQQGVIFQQHKQRVQLIAEEFSTEMKTVKDHTDEQIRKQQQSHAAALTQASQYLLECSNYIIKLNNLKEIEVEYNFNQEGEEQKMKRAQVSSTGAFIQDHIKASDLGNSSNRSTSVSEEVKVVEESARISSNVQLSPQSMKEISSFVEGGQSDTVEVIAKLSSSQQSIDSIELARQTPHIIIQSDTPEKGQTEIIGDTPINNSPELNQIIVVEKDSIETSQTVNKSSDDLINMFAALYGKDNLRNSAVQNLCSSEEKDKIPQLAASAAPSSNAYQKKIKILSKREQIDEVQEPGQTHQVQNTKKQKSEKQKKEEQSLIENSRSVMTQKGKINNTKKASQSSQFYVPIKRESNNEQARRYVRTNGGIHGGEESNKESSYSTESLAIEITSDQITQHLKSTQNHENSTPILTSSPKNGQNQVNIASSNFETKQLTENQIKEKPIKQQQQLQSTSDAEISKNCSSESKSTVLSDEEEVEKSW